MLRYIRNFTATALCVPLLAGHVQARETCDVVDFLGLDLAGARDSEAVEAALTLAYPSLTFIEGVVQFENGTRLPIGQDRSLPAPERLNDPTLREQFSQAYPLAFDLSFRETPWMDPGRARNDAFFRNLYFATKESAAQTVVKVNYQGIETNATFRVTHKHCVADQLQAALNEIRALGAGMDAYFEKTGGGFNWRPIAGTDRLSAHSFGIAVDLNTELGGYWRWSGRREGDAGVYTNRYPAEIVQIMERFGFIWGGKWHHFDGMHFEYRPELILFSRLTR